MLQGKQTEAHIHGGLCTHVAMGILTVLTHYITGFFVFVLFRSLIRSFKGDLHLQGKSSNFLMTNTSLGIGSFIVFFPDAVMSFPCVSFINRFYGSKSIMKVMISYKG